MIDACRILHPYALRPRWIGDLLAMYCEACPHLHVPPAPRADRVTDLPPTSVVPPGQREVPEASLRRSVA